MIKCSGTRLSRTQSNVSRVVPPQPTEGAETSPLPSFEFLIRHSSQTSAKKDGNSQSGTTMKSGHPRHPKKAEFCSLPRISREAPRSSVILCWSRQSSLYSQMPLKPALNNVFIFAFGDGGVWCRLVCKLVK